MHYTKLATLAAVCLFDISLCMAEVYEWKDERGIRHFASRPDHQGSKPADLPPIMREKSLRARIDLPAPATSACEGKGGINCEAGPDNDGSVICADGSLEATARFRQHCFTARLTINEMSEVDESGNALIYIRNEKGIAAKGTKVIFTRENGEILEAQGPLEIAPLGLEEFRLTGLIPLLEALTPGNLRVECENCGG